MAVVAPVTKTIDNIQVEVSYIRFFKKLQFYIYFVNLE